MRWMLNCWKHRVNQSWIRPDFLCIGAQKAGTTTLHHFLGRHPDVFLPGIKETHYFTLHFDRPEAWYASHFSEARLSQRVGEVTPYYLYHPAAPERIASTLPQVRCIVLLRDPVERAVSGYFHARRHGMETLSIEDAFAAEEDRLAGAERELGTPGRRHLGHLWHSYAARSRYEAQLARYQPWFRSSRLLLIRSEDLFRSPTAVWQRVLGFIGLPVDMAAGPLPHANPGDGDIASVPSPFRRRLRESLQPTYDAMRLVYGMEWP